MNELNLAWDIGIISLIALAGGLLAKKIRLPIVFGYITAGLVFNIFFGNSFGNKNDLSNIANIGIALLMFSLGLEFSFQRMLALKKVLIIGVSLQIIFTTIFLFIFGIIFSFNIKEALFFGIVCSLSSTAIVVKILSERNEIETQEGDVSINWLLSQDLAVLPISLLLPVLSFANKENSLNIIIDLFLRLFKTGVILIIVILLGRKVLPKIINTIAKLNSRELILIAAILISILFACLSLNLGLSFALGAFIAGLIISGSIENHAIFAEIRPIRDLFSMVFFVLLGIMVNPSFIIENLLIILALTIIVLFSKHFVVYILMRFYRYHPRIAGRVAINLVQVGEFAFVLSLIAFKDNMISSYLYSLIISVALLTIAITPFLIEKYTYLYKLSKIVSNNLPPFFHLKIFVTKEHQPNFNNNDLPFENHVVIIGFGRVGRNIGKLLFINKIPFVVVEMNEKVVSELKKDNIPVVYGDPIEYGVLDYAQVDKAKIIVIAIPDKISQEQIIENSLSLNKNIFIICRSHIEEDKKILQEKGAKFIIQPEFEASLTIGHKLLEKFDVSKDKINSSIKSLRIDQ